MKILFICGCLEPGRDGVGDYTRRLAGELRKQDIEVMIISVNDKFCNELCACNQQSEEETINVLRLPRTIDWPTKMKIVNKRITQFAPDWISLQYVPFAFNAKGLPFVFLRALRKIETPAKWHIMFHELAVGLNREAGIKDKCWGSLQLFLARVLFSKIKPKVSHTQSALYKELLSRNNISAGYLPLFSNIYSSDYAITEERDGPGDEFIQLVHFGGIYGGGPFHLFARELSEIQKATGKKFRIAVIGRSGALTESFIHIFISEGVEVKYWGEQPMDNIIREFKRSALGLVTTPLALVDKSGSLAAMQEFGLPIINLGKNWTPSGSIKITPPENVYPYPTEILTEILDTPVDNVRSATIKEVSTKFCEDLRVMS